MTINVTVDRLVYHACKGIRLQGDSLEVYAPGGIYEFAWASVQKFEVEVIPYESQLDRVVSENRWDPWDRVTQERRADFFETSGCSYRDESTVGYKGDGTPLSF